MSKKQKERPFKTRPEWLAHCRIQAIQLRAAYKPWIMLVREPSREVVSKRHKTPQTIKVLGDIRGCVAVYRHQDILYIGGSYAAEGVKFDRHEAAFRALRDAKAVNPLADPTMSVLPLPRKIRPVGLSEEFFYTLKAYLHLPRSCRETAQFMLRKVREAEAKAKTAATAGS